MSSGGVRLRDVFPAAPGGGLVVAGAGLEASVQDADQAAGQSSEGIVVFESLGALGVVEGAGTRETLSAAKAWIISASMSRSLRTNRAATILRLPEARVMGLVPA